MAETGFDLASWSEALLAAASGAVNPAFLPGQRRKCERELVVLTTPQNCICAVMEIKHLIAVEKNCRALKSS